MKKIFNYFIIIAALATSIGSIVLIFINQSNTDTFLNSIIKSVLVLIIVLGVTAVLLFSNSAKDIKTGSMCLLLLMVTMVSNGLDIFNSNNVLSYDAKSIPSFINEPVSDAILWAEDNNVELIQTFDYSDNIEENNVVFQNFEILENTKGEKTLDVCVSLGPNYGLLSSIPDMTGKDIDEVIDVIKKANLSNADILFEFSAEKKNTLINQSTSGDVIRNTPIKFTFSLGTKENLKPVKLKDLKNMKKFDAEIYLKQNGIKYTIATDFSDTVKKGKVIKTTPKAKTTINQDTDSIILTISRGKKIVVPDFNKMSLEEIIKWSSKNQLKIKYTSSYDEKVKNGEIIHSSVKKGDILESGNEIILNTSKGPLKMISSDNLAEILAFAKDNNITVNETSEFSKTIANGKIISISHKASQIIKNNETIDIVVSKGAPVIVTNFVGLSSSAAQNKCKELKLSPYLVYEYSNTVAKGVVIRQNIKEGSEVSEGIGITLTISSGKYVAPPLPPEPPKPPVCSTNWVMPDITNVVRPSLGNPAGLVSTLNNYFKSNTCISITVAYKSGTGQAPGNLWSGNEIKPGVTLYANRSYVYYVTY